MEEKKSHSSSDENKKVVVKEDWREWVKFALLALIIVIPIRVYVAQPFVVSGESMNPTFTNRDYLIVDEISYHLGEPARYDAAVFRFPQNPKKFFIKRVIGLPNETVKVEGNQITIINKENPEGFQIVEPYVKSIGSIDKTLTLGPDEYFLAGDNRNASYDSRYWGAVDEKYMIGKALLRLYPLSKIELMPGKYTPDQEELKSK